MEDGLGLRAVDDSGDVAAALVGELRERAENRPGGDHRRGDPHAAPRATDGGRDPVRELLAVPRGEPGGDLRTINVDGSRLDPAAVSDVRLRPRSEEHTSELQSRRDL